MPIHRKIKKQINTLVMDLVGSGLSDDQNPPFEKTLSNGFVEITFQGANNLSIAMKNMSYTEIYDRLKEERAYLAKMADGALLQMMYIFKDGELERHRLAFFPSPHLEEFQNAPEIYLEDDVYADIIDKNIVPFPIRFDFDTRDGVHEEVAHPISHLTLGQYRNCRIPVTAPLMPYHFIEFILRNFYHTAHERYCEKLTLCNGIFNNSIARAEQEIVHINVPTVRV